MRLSTLPAQHSPDKHNASPATRGGNKPSPDSRDTAAKSSGVSARSSSCYWGSTSVETAETDCFGCGISIGTGIGWDGSRVRVFRGR